MQPSQLAPGWQAGPPHLADWHAPLGPDLHPPLGQLLGGLALGGARGAALAARLAGRALLHRAHGILVLLHGGAQVDPRLQQGEGALVELGRGRLQMPMGNWDGTTKPTHGAQLLG